MFTPVESKMVNLCKYFDKAQGLVGLICYRKAIATFGLNRWNSTTILIIDRPDAVKSVGQFLRDLLMMIVDQGSAYGFLVPAANINWLLVLTLASQDWCRCLALFEVVRLILSLVLTEVIMFLVGNVMFVLDQVWFLFSTHHVS